MESLQYCTAEEDTAMASCMPKYFDGTTEQKTAQISERSSQYTMEDNLLNRKKSDTSSSIKRVLGASSLEHQFEMDTTKHSNNKKKRTIDGQIEESAQKSVDRNFHEMRGLFVPKFSTSINESTPFAYQDSKSNNVPQTSENVQTSYLYLYRNDEIRSLNFSTYDEQRLKGLPGIKTKVSSSYNEYTEIPASAQCGKHGPPEENLNYSMNLLSTDNMSQFPSPYTSTIVTPDRHQYLESEWTAAQALISLSKTDNTSNPGKYNQAFTNSVEKNTDEFRYHQLLDSTVSGGLVSLRKGENIQSGSFNNAKRRRLSRFESSRNATSNLSEVLGEKATDLNSAVNDKQLQAPVDKSNSGIHLASDSQVPLFYETEQSCQLSNNLHRIEEDNDLSILKCIESHRYFPSKNKSSYTDPTISHRQDFKLSHEPESSQKKLSVPLHLEETRMKRQDETTTFPNLPGIVENLKKLAEIQRKKSSLYDEYNGAAKSDKNIVSRYEKASKSCVNLHPKDKNETLKLSKISETHGLFPSKNKNDAMDTASPEVAMIAPRDGFSLSRNRNNDGRFEESAQKSDDRNFHVQTFDTTTAIISNKSGQHYETDQSLYQNRRRNHLNVLNNSELRGNFVPKYYNSIIDSAPFAYHDSKSENVHLTSENKLNKVSCGNLYLNDETRALSYSGNDEQRLKELFGITTKVSSDGGENGTQILGLVQYDKHRPPEENLNYSMNLLSIENMSQFPSPDISTIVTPDRHQYLESEWRAPQVLISLSKTDNTSNPGKYNQAFTNSVEKNTDEFRYHQLLDSTVSGGLVSLRKGENIQSGSFNNAKRRRLSRFESSRNATSNLSEVLGEKATDLNSAVNDKQLQAPVDKSNSGIHLASDSQVPLFYETEQSCQLSNNLHRIEEDNDLSILKCIERYRYFPSKNKSSYTDPTISHRQDFKLSHEPESSQKKLSVPLHLEETRMKRQDETTTFPNLPGIVENLKKLAEIQRKKSSLYDEYNGAAKSDKNIVSRYEKASKSCVNLHPKDKNETLKLSKISETHGLFPSKNKNDAMDTASPEVAMIAPRDGFSLSRNRNNDGRFEESAQKSDDRNFHVQTFDTTTAIISNKSGQHYETDQSLYQNRRRNHLNVLNNSELRGNFVPKYYNSIIDSAPFAYHDSKSENVHLTSENKLNKVSCGNLYLNDETRALSYSGNDEQRLKELFGITTKVSSDGGENGTQILGLVQYDKHRPPEENLNYSMNLLSIENMSQFPSPDISTIVTPDRHQYLESEWRAPQVLISLSKTDNTSNPGKYNQAFTNSVEKNTDEFRYHQLLDSTVSGGLVSLRKGENIQSGSFNNAKRRRLSRFESSRNATSNLSEVLGEKATDLNSAVNDKQLQAPVDKSNSGIHLASDSQVPLFYETEQSCQLSNNLHRIEEDNDLSILKCIERYRYFPSKNKSSYTDPTISHRQDFKLSHEPESSQKKLSVPLHLEETRMKRQDETTTFPNLPGIVENLKKLAEIQRKKSSLYDEYNGAAKSDKNIVSRYEKASKSCVNLHPKDKNETLKLSKISETHGLFPSKNKNDAMDTASPEVAMIAPRDGFSLSRNRNNDGRFEESAQKSDDRNFHVQTFDTTAAIISNKSGQHYETDQSLYQNRRRNHLNVLNNSELRGNFMPKYYNSITDSAPFAYHDSKSENVHLTSENKLNKVSCGNLYLNDETRALSYSGNDEQRLKELFGITTKVSSDGGENGTQILGLVQYDKHRPPEENRNHFVNLHSAGRGKKTSQFTSPDTPTIVTPGHPQSLESEQALSLMLLSKQNNASNPVTTSKNIQIQSKKSTGRSRYHQSLDSTVSGGLSCLRKGENIESVPSNNAKQPRLLEFENNRSIDNSYTGDLRVYSKEGPNSASSLNLHSRQCTNFNPIERNEQFMHSGHTYSNDISHPEPRVSGENGQHYASSLSFRPEKGSHNLYFTNNAEHPLAFSWINGNQIMGTSASEQRDLTLHDGPVPFKNGFSSTSGLNFHQNENGNSFSRNVELLKETATNGRKSYSNGTNNILIFDSALPNKCCEKTGEKLCPWENLCSRKGNQISNFSGDRSISTLASKTENNTRNTPYFQTRLIKPFHPSLSERNSLNLFPNSERTSFNSVKEAEIALKARCNESGYHQSFDPMSTIFPKREHNSESQMHSRAFVNDANASSCSNLYSALNSGHMEQQLVGPVTRGGADAGYYQMFGATPFNESMSSNKRQNMHTQWHHKKDERNILNHSKFDETPKHFSPTMNCHAINNTMVTPSNNTFGMPNPASLNGLVYSESTPINSLQSLQSEK